MIESTFGRRYGRTSSMLAQLAKAATENPDKLFMLFMPIGSNMNTNIINDLKNVRVERLETIERIDGRTAGSNPEIFVDHFIMENSAYAYKRMFEHEQERRRSYEKALYKIKNILFDVDIL